MTEMGHNMLLDLVDAQKEIKKHVHLLEPGESFTIQVRYRTRGMFIAIGNIVRVACSKREFEVRKSRKAWTITVTKKES